ncbi:MAG TPA: chromosome segregation protein SMC [Terriglobales bacterium]|nr:chromosome segregation protein SMC [Terriglobales bacterium]
MLKLKKLQILGFKSFCDRTDLRFQGDGITAIVGPNGCGKSNISDAISWVLGEQSARLLRGVHMADVIFNGTRDRKPTGMAEVSLTLVDPEIYGDVAEPEIDIQDDLPEDDWDESALRADRAADVERYSEEVRPGQSDEESATAVSAGTQQIPPEAEDCHPEQSEGSAVRTGATSEATKTAAPHVVLKIRRRKFKRTFKAGEIQITRRLFRSGESEYLLNGKLCRLRDIHDIFMGTGLGPESYAIIEQGRIGQILSSKPTDRRAIIEEAAGITKYKTRKRLAEARLEDAKLNLSRINDIFDEVARQMNSLKRQASKAERYARLRDEMRAKLRVVLASKFAQLDSEASSLDQQLSEIASEIHAQTEAVEQMESEHGERTQRGYAIEREAQENREKLNSLAIDLDRAASRRRTNEERCAELDARSAGAQAEIANTEERAARLQQELETDRATLESASSDVARAQEELQQRQQESAAASASLIEVERQQEQRRDAMLQAVSAASGVRNRITQAEERIAALNREAQRLENESTVAQEQLIAFGGQRGQLNLEFETSSQRVTALTAQIFDTRQRLDAKRAGETEAKRQLDSLRGELATIMGKRASLEAAITEHGYATESVRKLFTSGALQGGRAPAGVLADFLEVEDRYEHVVDDFLRDELNYIVVKSWDAADEGLRLLRTDVDGRATFLVHPEDSQAKFSFHVDESAQPASHGEGVVPLKHCIRVLNGFGKSLEVILPKLGNGYIVPDPEVGRSLALENPGAFFLSKSGECFHNVTVTGGKQRSQGPLAMKRELRDVLLQMGSLERTIGDTETYIAVLGGDIAELTSLLDRLEDEKREAEREAMTSEHTLRQLDSEMTRIRERLFTFQSEQERISAERTNSETFITSELGELFEHEERQRALEAESQAAQSSLESLRQRRDEAAQIATEVRASVATLEERRRGAMLTVQRIEAMLSEVSEHLAKLKSQLDSATAEKHQREAENVRLAEQVIDWTAQRDITQQRDRELQEELQAARARIVELEESLKSAREALNAARDRRGELAAAQARVESDIQHMAETCVQELSQPREELLADTSLPRITGEELATEDTAYREMRTRLENMGPVNMMALEEYKETAERHQFLETQRQDLLQSIENTQNTIKEIDTISRQKFEEAFNIINENFGRTFSKLFGGGQGFMRLTDQENSMESGIDVVASPPGKKLQNVLLLSGGEKALTALALLVGIFQYQPSPFCILDEVDAPLDEANVGRFTELVREMSAQTQFIIITHSKKTMNMAPILYGVTMQEPGVSKLVSVRFNEERAPLAAATA